MPAQFKHLAPALARRGHRVVFLTKRQNVELSGVERRTYPSPRGAGRATHAYVRHFEAAVRYGQNAARGLLALVKDGYTPDLIIAHPGWGEALFVKDVCPSAKLINLCEFYYAGRGLDLGFDPETPASLDMISKARAKNAHFLLSLESCDAAVSPTNWQKSVHPSGFRDKIEVIFDGIDLKMVHPRERAVIALDDGRKLCRGSKVVTYVARNLEPYRGFRTFMRAIPHIQHSHDDVDILIVGDDDVSYGRKPAGFETWREAMLAEVEFDRSRVHFLGKLPYDKYLDVLSVSAAHVYLTYPFVLSWSCLEAMAAGALVIGSDTPPVREVIRDGENGLLTDFFDERAVAARVSEALADPSQFSALRAAARMTVADRYCVSLCLPKWEALIDRVMSRNGPAQPRERRTRMLSVPEKRSPRSS